jgi:hypothetical protein
MADIELQELRRLERAYNIHQKLCEKDNDDSDGAIREELEHLVAAYHIAEQFMKADKDIYKEELDRLYKVFTR